MNYNIQGMIFLECLKTDSNKIFDSIGSDAYYIFGIVNWAADARINRYTNI